MLHACPYACTYLQILHLYVKHAGGVLGYAQQVTKCCNCSGFIEVLDASNQVMYTIQGEPQFLLTDFSVCSSLECARRLMCGMCCLNCPVICLICCLAIAFVDLRGKQYAPHHRLRFTSVASATHAPAVLLAPYMKVMGSKPIILPAQLNQISLREDAPQSPSVSSKPAEPLHS